MLVSLADKVLHLFKQGWGDYRGVVPQDWLISRHPMAVLYDMWLENTDHGLTLDNRLNACRAPVSLFTECFVALF